MRGTKLDLKRSQVLGDDYGPSEEYTDKVECVPMALAALLIMFVEDEHDGPEKFQEHIDWRIKEAAKAPEDKGNIQGWIAAEDKILQLYRWWTKERPKLMKREQELLHQWSTARNPEGLSNLVAYFNAPDTPRSKELFEAHNDLEQRIRAEMQEFCYGVISIREYLWT